MGIKRVFNLFFGKLTLSKYIGWFVVFVLFFLYYIFFLGNMVEEMLYLLLYSLPFIWLATIIGGTIEIIKIVKEINKKGG